MQGFQVKRIFLMGPGCHGLPNLKWAWTFLKSGLTTKWPIKTYFVVALRPPILYGKLAGWCADKIPQEAGALIEWVSLGEADVKDCTFSTKCWLFFSRIHVFWQKLSLYKMHVIQSFENYYFRLIYIISSMHFVEHHFWPGAAFCRVFAAGWHSIL